MLTAPKLRLTATTLRACRYDCRRSLPSRSVRCISSRHFLHLQFSHMLAFFAGGSPPPTTTPPPSSYFDVAICTDLPPICLPPTTPTPPPLPLSTTLYCDALALTCGTISLISSTLITTITTITPHLPAPTLSLPDLLLSLDVNADGQIGAAELRAASERLATLSAIPIDFATAHYNEFSWWSGLDW